MGLWQAFISVELAFFFNAYTGASIFKGPSGYFSWCPEYFEIFKKTTHKTPHFLLLFSLNPCPSNFLHMTLKGDFSKIYCVLRWCKFWKIKSWNFEALPHFRHLSCHFVCQICLKLSLEWNFNLTWIKNFSRLNRTCFFCLHPVHNSSSEMFLFLSDFTWLLEFCSL